ncbi:MAG TPA: hypothetical protein DCQ50_07915 [Chryseobacterium sp.]|nr:hypothetical protein [Chryseobacterium sp.]
MKNFYFNIQSKGGAGKSMLTYLQALKHEHNPDVAFVNLDSSTKTSVTQLNFIAKSGRLIKTDIYDRTRKLDRDRFISVLEGLAQLEMTNFYIDFGAPESEQLPGLFTIDYSIEEFKEMEQELEAKFIFNVIMAGGPAYEPCFAYLKQLTEIINGRFDINVFINLYTFRNYQKLVDDLESFIKATNGLIKNTIPFGDFYPDRMAGTTLFNNVRDGKGSEACKGLSLKLILKRELAKII